MNALSFEEYLRRLPDTSMKTKIYTEIINTPPTDFTEMQKEVDEYVARRIAEMTPEERKEYGIE